MNGRSLRLDAQDVAPFPDIDPTNQRSRHAAFQTPEASSHATSAERFGESVAYDLLPR